MRTVGRHSLTVGTLAESALAQRNILLGDIAIEGDIGQELRNDMRGSHTSEWTFTMKSVAQFHPHSSFPNRLA